MRFPRLTGRLYQKIALVKSGQGKVVWDELRKRDSAPLPKCAFRAIKAKTWDDRLPS